MTATVIVVLAVLAVGWMLAKRLNPTIVLLVTGTMLLVLAPLLGRQDFGSLTVPETGNAVLDQLSFVAAIFGNRLAGVGLVIMVLFGFSSYMSHIGANDVAVQMLTGPMLRLRLRYLLVPIVFWVGNLLSLVVPSASSLAVLLMATLYPTMVAVGLSRLTAGAVIATTATIMPTSLGADNVIAAERLGIDLVDYTFGMHARISIPTLFVIGIVHYFWQRFMDRRDARRALLDSTEDASAVADDAGTAAGAVTAAGAGSGTATTTTRPAAEVAAETGPTPPRWYAVLPLLPLLLVIAPRALAPFGVDVSVSLVPVTLLSLMLVLLIELVRRRDLPAVFDDATVFVKGMGTGLSTVVGLVIAAGVFVEGITQLGVIDTLSDAVQNASSGTLILVLAFVLLMLVLTLLTGGVAPFYSLVELVPRISASTGINGALLTLPIQFVGNLGRAMSPVAAVVIIVAQTIKVTPFRLITRTAVPMGVGIVLSTVLTLVLL
ncbi:MAG TPA: C4-dicarboxylate transporter DcuC [Cellulomonas sp.]